VTFVAASNPLIKTETIELNEGTSGDKENAPIWCDEGKVEQLHWDPEGHGHEVGR